jgi:hypothetical protein
MTHKAPRYSHNSFLKFHRSPIIGTLLNYEAYMQWTLTAVTGGCRLAGVWDIQVVISAAQGASPLVSSSTNLLVPGPPYRVTTHLCVSRGHYSYLVHAKSKVVALGQRRRGFIGHVVRNLLDCLSCTDDEQVVELQVKESVQIRTWRARVVLTLTDGADFCLFCHVSCKRIDLAGTYRSHVGIWFELILLISYDSRVLPNASKSKQGLRPRGVGKCG